MKAPLIEVSLEGMPGPTHHFGGLAYGNLHAMAHAKTPSSPKRAALESLTKMSLLLKLGVKVLLMPPQPRPNQAFLSEMGFRGSLMAQLRSAHTQAPTLFLAALSSSFMWTANAATVTASGDSCDGKVHVTPANLLSQIHRATETAAVSRFFEIHMASENMVIHPPLPAPFADEGAANLIRLENSDGQGYYLFAYGRSLVDTLVQPQLFPARQTREACEAIIRRHGLAPRDTICVQQHPDAIDAGVFHQDVVAFGHQRTLVAHELAYVLLRSASPNEEEKAQGASPLGPQAQGALPLGEHVDVALSHGASPRGAGEPGASSLGAGGQGATPQGEREGAALEQKTPFPGEGVGMGPRMAQTQPLKTLPLDIHRIEIPNAEVPLSDLVTSYLCNGQIITDRDHRRVFLVPSRCQHIPTVQRWLRQNLPRFADDLRYIPVEESLKNGGGPACLRLRMPLTETEWRQLHPAIKLTPEKIQQLEQVVASLYPDTFHPTDILADACLAQCLRVTEAIGVVLG